MKAILMHGYGGPEVLEYTDAPDPIAAPGEIVVDVHAVSLNPADWKVREGLRKNDVKARFPHVLGRDFSGVVRETGAGVADFSPGDPVFAVNEQGREGAYAEAVAVPAALAARKPDFLTHAEASALAMTGLTALRALEDEAKLQAGETILVHAGAGGVGGFAVQYARHAGATVYATASAANHAYVKESGAHHAVDYTKADFREAVPPCDVVFDTIGGEVHARSFSALKPGGRLVHIAAGPPGFIPPREDVRVIRPDVRRDRAHLERIVELAAAGAVRPPYIREMPLAEAAEAQEISRTGHVRGKIILTPR